VAVVVERFGFLCFTILVVGRLGVVLAVASLVGPCEGLLCSLRLLLGCPRGVLHLCKDLTIRGLACCFQRLDSRWWLRGWLLLLWCFRRLGGCRWLQRVVLGVVAVAGRRRLGGGAGSMRGCGTKGSQVALRLQEAVPWVCASSGGSRKRRRYERGAFRRLARLAGTGSMRLLLSWC
jgi:hypothetical protein